MGVMKCTAAGDAMVFRRLPGAYAGFDELREFILRGDFRYVNLETTVHNFECFGSAESGGSWLCAAPEILEDLKQFGFNILANANNHALDYSYGGLEKTLENIRAAGFQPCGTGMSLAEAAAPVYLDTLAGRFALIGACSTFHPGDMAGEQTRTLPGRPGINGIRHKTVYKVTAEQMECLKSIAAGTAINGQKDISRAEGYLPPIPEGKMVLGELEFQVSDAPGMETTVNPVDMGRMGAMIREARFMADMVIVSMHSHEIRARSKEEPAQFYEDFCHKCIDAGADAVIGTGPHLLRPIEIYRGKPIFYSLGDFIIQLENIQRAPTGMFEKQHLSGNATLDELFNARSDNGRRGLCYQRIMHESVVPYWEMENGELTKLTLLPVEMNFGEPRSRAGWPRPKADAGILERLAAMSEPYGVKIEIEGGVGRVAL